MFLERAVAFAQEHGDVVGADVSRGQVEAAVAVEIARDQGERAPTPAAMCDRGLKRAVAVAQEHRDIVGVGVGDGQVEMAVAEVARHDRAGVRPDGERRRRAGTCRRRCLGGYPPRFGSSRSRPGRGGPCRSRPPRWMSACSPSGSAIGRQGREIPPALIGQDGDVAGVECRRRPGRCGRCSRSRPRRSRRGLARPAIGCESWNVPSPLLRRIVTSFGAGVGDGQVDVAVAGEVARHDRVGRAARRQPNVGAGWNVPSPLPREIETLSVPARATATSRLWSPLKSPTAIADGLVDAWGRPVRRSERGPGTCRRRYPGGRRPGRRCRGCRCW